MLRGALIRKKAKVGGELGWRSFEVSRIEGLSDAVFAFAVTLLVVSLESPRTVSELYQTMHGFLPFAITFAMLFQIWYAQFLWFRRHGLEDTTTVLLNGVLLFVVLFYVYPLKFLFTYLADLLTGGNGMAHLADGRTVPILAARDAVPMMVIYDVFILLYAHA